MENTHMLGVVLTGVSIMFLNIFFLLVISEELFDGKYSFWIYFGGFAIESLLLGLYFI